MSIVNYLRSLLLRYVYPGTLAMLVPFLFGVVFWSDLDAIPSPRDRVVKYLCLLVVLPVFHGTSHSYPAWFETAQTEANSHQPIGAHQFEADLEAQPLNFPPMPDMTDLTFNPWELP